MEEKHTLQHHKFGIIVIVGWMALWLYCAKAIAQTQSQFSEAEFVPGEIIVKLKDKTTFTTTRQPSEANVSALKEEPGVVLPRLFSELKVRHKVKHIEKVFGRGMEKIKAKGIPTMSQQEQVSTIRAKFSKRTLRAPKKIQPPNLENIFKIEVEEKDADVPSLARQLSTHPDVEYAEPNYIMHAFITPNDPYFNSSGSWGQSYDDMWGLKKIQMSSAWDISRGSQNIVVAVIDTGIDYNHPDLSANIWFNQDEIAGNGIDDDNNGYIDDVKGWNFVYNDNDPMDGHTHGTHVSGTIAAVTNNAQGVAGINWHIKLMALKGLSDEGSGSVAGLAEAIIYAADNGADVLSNSWGGSGSSSTLEDAITYAHGLGCVVVAAAGNDNTDALGFTPANIKNVITVSAFDHNDKKADFSNYGAKIDVAAPGVDILSTYSTYLDAPLVSKLNVISDNNKYLQSLPLEYSAKTPTGGLTAVVLYAGLGYASDFQGKDFKGKIALIKRGEFTFSEKVKNAADVGASGVIIFNNVSGNFAGTLGEESTIPAGSISLEDGNYLLSLINTKQTTVKMAVVSSPDYYDHFSGTSMACPHVSGLAALILGRHPEFTNEQVRSIIRASSDDIINPINDGKNYPGFDIYSGYGRINAYKALQINAVPLAKITSPSNNDIISGTVEIYGTAIGPQFRSYTLEYGNGILPNQWFKIKDSNSAVEEGLLGAWDVNRLPYGIYTLRLKVQDASFPNPFEDRASLSLTFSYQQGWPKETQGMIISSPALGDIDNDGTLEVVVGSYDKKVYAWRNNGALVSGWTKETQGNIASSPAIANLDKTGNLEIIIGSNDGKVYAWHSNGTLVSGWPKTTNGAVVSSPAVADIDGDGKLEVVVGSYDNNVYAWHSDGTLVSGWPRETGGPVVSSPALADLDGDGKLEIIIGSTDKKLYIWRYNRTLLSGWPKDTGGQIVSSPAIGDLDNNGSFEIVCGSNNNKVSIWDKSGNLISGWPRYTDGAIESSPVLGDINNDGKLEVVVGAYDKKVYAWHSNGGLVSGWPKETEDLLVSSPILVDINNDGFLDIVIGSLDNKVYAWQYDGRTIKGWPISLKGAIESSAAFGDLDADGDVDLVFGSTDNQIYVFDLDTGCLPLAIQWQMFKESPNRLSEAEIIPEADGSNGLLMFKVTATNPTGKPLTFSASGIPQGAGFSPLTQIFRWQPTPSQLGNYKVTFTVTDGNLSDSETITIYIVGNPLPYLYPIGDKKVYEGRLLEFYLRATDPNNEPLTFSACNLPAKATFNPLIALFRWRPDFNQAGIYPHVHFEVTDGTSVGCENITITVFDSQSDTTPPAKPQPDPVKSPTNINPVLLKGTKEAGSSLLINGIQVVPVGPETTWSYSYRLTEGNNHLTITSQDASGNTSEAVVRDIVLDTVAPTVRITNPADGTTLTLP